MITRIDSSGNMVKTLIPRAVAGEKYNQEEIVSLIRTAKARGYEGPPHKGDHVTAAIGNQVFQWLINSYPDEFQWKALN